MTELAVLVPVLSRPQNVKPLVESFLAGCPDDSELCFIISRQDRHHYDDVPKMPRVLRVWTEAITWPEKINKGVRRVPADFYLLAADDVTFTPGWFEEAFKVHVLTGKRVIGTCDAANPRTGYGEPEATRHSTHTLVARSYIEELGIRDFPGVDVPGFAVCSDYGHWMVDDELVWTAKYRDEWAHATDAIVKHAHPYFSSHVPWDATYQRGQDCAVADQLLFAKRASLFGVQVNND